MKSLLLTALGGLAFTVATLNPSFAAQDTFRGWLDDTRQAALKKGISTNIVEEALHSGLSPIQRIIELDRKQPEGKITFATYRERIVNPTRIKKGREMMRKHESLLKEVGEKYGVQPQYIVALWGIETNFGSNTGGFDVVNALATLAYDGRRRDFFTAELMNALTILDQGHIKYKDMKGSWAGAMGQSQFMPSSFLAYAQDYDGDGHKDIWNTQADVFASAANYLSKSGWHGDERWGRLVELPKNFPRNLEGLDVKKSLAEWQKLGVRRANGRDLPIVDGMTASVVQPDGKGNSAYLVYNNYRVVMKWNKSTYFATSVGLLADALAAY